MGCCRLCSPRLRPKSPPVPLRIQAASTRSTRRVRVRGSQEGRSHCRVATEDGRLLPVSLATPPCLATPFALVLTHLSEETLVKACYTRSVCSSLPLPSPPRQVRRWAAPVLDGLLHVAPDMEADGAQRLCSLPVAPPARRARRQRGAARAGAARAGGYIRLQPRHMRLQPEHMRLQPGSMGLLPGQVGLQPEHMGSQPELVPSPCYLVITPRAGAGRGAAPRRGERHCQAARHL